MRTVLSAKIAGLSQHQNGLQPAWLLKSSYFPLRNPLGMLKADGQALSDTILN